MSSIEWVVFDLDGTLTRTSTMAFIAHQTGHGEIAEQLTSDYESGRATNTEVSNTYADILQEIMEHHSERDLEDILEKVDLVDGINEVVAALKTSGVRCGISTVTFDFIAEHFRRRLGFERWWASTLKRDHANRLTGQIDTVSESTDKLRGLVEFCVDSGLDLAQVAFVGNGRSDVHVMQQVGLSVAFNASDDARSVACLDVTGNCLTSIFAPHHPFRCVDRRQVTCAHPDTQPWLPVSFECATSDAWVEARR